MPNSNIDIRQSQTRILQDQLNSVATTQMDSTLASINNELTPPGRLIAQATPSLVVTIGSGSIVNPNTSKNRVLPFISGAPVSFAGGTITFPSASGTITVSPGTNGSIAIGASQYVAVLVQLSAAGDLSVAVGSAAGSLGAVVIPTGVPSLLSLGYIIVESNGSSVIQSVTNAMLYQFVGGGGSGGGTSSGLKNYLTTYTASTSSNTPNPGNGNFESGSTSGWSIASTSLSGVFPSSVASPGSAFSSTSGGSPASSDLSFSTVSSGQLAGLYSGDLVSTGSINTLVVQIPLASRNAGLTLEVSDNIQYVGQIFTLGSSINLSQISLSMDQLGSFVGTISVQVVNDSAGSPNLSSVVATSTNSINTSDLTTGVFNQQNFLFSLIPISAGTYHIVVIPDSTYLASATNPNTAQVGTINAGASSPFLQTYNGSTWASSSENLNFALYAGSSVPGDLLISNAFFIDIEDQAKALGFSFSYNANSGSSNLNFSGTSDNTFAVYIYDVTNGAWIQPAGVYNLVQGSGVGFCNGTFQTSSNSTQYQIALISVNVPTGAYSLYVDDFFVGPQIYVNAPSVSDWVSYVPMINGYGTPTGIDFWYRRVGDSVEVNGLFVSGSPTAVEAQIGLPNGMVIDSSKFSNNPRMVGTYETNNDGDASIFTVISVGGSAYFVIGERSGSTLPLDGIDANVLTVNGATQVIQAIVPIAGWSSNAIASNDTDTRVVAAGANTATGTLSNSSPTIVVFSNTLYDSHAEYNSSSGIYTVPVSGIYPVKANVTIASGGFVAGNIENLAILKNGVVVASTELVIASVSVGDVSLDLSNDVKCVAGDEISIQIIPTFTGSASFTATATDSTLSISRISGPAVVTASETVAARYSDTSGGSIGTSSALYAFQTISYDTHDAYSTISGLYSVPVSGIYSVKAALITGAVNLTTGQACGILLVKNGSTWSYGKIEHGTGVSSSLGMALSDDVECNAGDTLAIYAFSNVATTAYTASGYNYLSIAKTGKGS